MDSAEVRIVTNACKLLSLFYHSYPYAHRLSFDGQLVEFIGSIMHWPIQCIAVVPASRLPCGEAIASRVRQADQDISYDCGTAWPCMSEPAYDKLSVNVDFPCCMTVTQ